MLHFQKFKELDSLAKFSSKTENKEKNPNDVHNFFQSINNNKTNHEEKTRNIIKKLGENFNSIVDSVNFNCKDNNDIENKMSKINSEIENLNSKINKGKN